MIIILSGSAWLHKTSDWPITPCLDLILSVNNAAFSILSYIRFLKQNRLFPMIAAPKNFHARFHFYWLRIGTTTLRSVAPLQSEGAATEAEGEANSRLSDPKTMLSESMFKIFLFDCLHVCFRIWIFRKRRRKEDQVEPPFTPLCGSQFCGWSAPPNKS